MKLPALLGIAVILFAIGFGIIFGTKFFMKLNAPKDDTPGE